MIARPVTRVTAETHVRLRDGDQSREKTSYTFLILNLG
jgi:hypothetical protein